MSLMADGHNLPPEVYQIRIRGRLDAHWSDWLGGLALTYGGPDGCDTILCGRVVDQAALHGLLVKIRDLGVPLLTVQRVEPDPGHGYVSARDQARRLQREGEDHGDADTME